MKDEEATVRMEGASMETSTAVGPDGSDTANLVLVSYVSNEDHSATCPVGAILGAIKYRNSNDAWYYISLALGACYAALPLQQLPVAPAQPAVTVLCTCTVLGPTTTIHA